jgi:hypothetical protein
VGLDFKLWYVRSVSCAVPIVSGGEPFPYGVTRIVYSAITSMEFLECMQISMKLRNDNGR